MRVCSIYTMRVRVCSIYTMRVRVCSIYTMRVQGAGCRPPPRGARAPLPPPHPQPRASAARTPAPGGFWFRLPGIGYRVPGFEYAVLGFAPMPKPCRTREDFGFEIGAVSLLKQSLLNQHPRLSCAKVERRKRGARAASSRSRRFRVPGFQVRVPGFEGLSGTKALSSPVTLNQVPSFGFRVSGSGFRVLGFRFRVPGLSFGLRVSVSGSGFQG